MSEVDWPRDEYGFIKPEREWSAAERAKYGPTLRRVQEQKKQQEVQREQERRKQEEEERRKKVEVQNAIQEQLETTGKILERFHQRHYGYHKSWRSNCDRFVTRAEGGGARVHDQWYFKMLDGVHVMYYASGSIRIELFSSHPRVSESALAELGKVLHEHTGLTVFVDKKVETPEGKWVSDLYGGSKKVASYGAKTIAEYRQEHD